MNCPECDENHELHEGTCSFVYCPSGFNAYEEEVLELNFEPTEEREYEPDIQE